MKMLVSATVAALLSSTTTVNAYYGPDTGSTITCHWVGSVQVCETKRITYSACGTTCTTIAVFFSILGVVVCIVVLCCCCCSPCGEKEVRARPNREPVRVSNARETAMVEQPMYAAAGVPLEMVEVSVAPPGSEPFANPNDFSVGYNAADAVLDTGNVYYRCDPAAPQMQSSMAPFQS